MSDHIVFDTLCPIGTKLQHQVDRDTAEVRRLAQVLMDAEDTYIAHIPRYKAEVAAARSKLAAQRIELYRHAGHCLDGCVRTAGQFVGERSTSWNRAPSHDKPEVPSAADLAEMIRDGATLDDLATRYDRYPATLGARLTKAGWSTRTGQTLTTTAPLRRLARSLFDAQPWRDDAICAQTDPEEFYPDKGRSTTRDAKAVCAGCTVSAECLDYAIANNERFGIWGGLSERERRKVAAALRAEQNTNLDTHLDTQQESA